MFWNLEIIVPFLFPVTNHSFKKTHELIKSVLYFYLRRMLLFMYDCQGYVVV